MAWTTEQAYPISLDVVLSVNLTTILLYYITLFCMYVCIYVLFLKDIFELQYYYYSLMCSFCPSQAQLTIKY